MAYKNKTYICFDADTDMLYYRLMTAWNENGNIAFNFHNAHDLNNLMSWSSEETIKRKLRERLANTKVLVVLVGQKTKNLHKYVRWEIEYALENDIPIIVANLNKTNGMDNTLCPPILKNQLAVHVPFNQKSLDHALNHWPGFHEKCRKEKKSGHFVYNNLK